MTFIETCVMRSYIILIDIYELKVEVSNMTVCFIQFYTNEYMSIVMCTSYVITKKIHINPKPNSKTSISIICSNHEDKHYNR
jgi:hypothetical protein